MSNQIYQNRLAPWAVFQILFPSSPNKLVNRYRNRNDAEEYAKLLTHSTGQNHQVVFDRSETFPHIPKV
ncbi:MAG TPA: hypothetical protein VK203_03290 [Nostocaceae cyanobacterium]|nr:hypothetical protein [Nostocaceae cyanobacterium]